MTDKSNYGKKFKSFILVFGVTVLFIIIIIRLYFLQINSSIDLVRKAEKQSEGILKVEPVRGKIVDRNNNLLAVSLKVKSIFCVPYEVDNIWNTAKTLSLILKIPKNKLIKKLAKNSKFAWIKRKVEDSEALKIEKANLKGIYSIDEVKRFYPKSHLLSHVIGFVNIDNNGLSGIEYSFDEFLKGESGAAKIITDAKGRELVAHRDFIKLPKDGADVVLTIDEVIQNFVEEELEKLCEAFEPISVTAIVMDIKNGDILALSNRPTFNLNDISSSSLNDRKNCALVNIYEPGSLFKIITAAAALNEGIVTLDEVIYCEQGAYRIGGHTLHDSHPNDYLSFEDVIAQSSNIGFAKVISRMESAKFYDYILRFGFNQKTGIPLSGENKGLVWHYKKWSGYSKSAIAMGHEIMATPLQMACAISSIANNGRKISPRIIDKIISKDENLIKTYEINIGEKIVNDKSINDLIKALTKVVSSEGTANKAKIEGYKVAGKTGTAQKFVDGKYSRSKYVSSFYGFFPADDPKISITIMVDEPTKRAYGGTAAAPFFSSMGEKIINYLIPRPLAFLDNEKGDKYVA